MLTEKDFQEISTWFDHYLNCGLVDLEDHSIEEVDELRSRAITVGQKLYDLRNKLND